MAAAAAGGQGASGPQGYGAPQAAGRVKWVKLAVAELKKAPKQRLKWRALWAALQEHAAAAEGGGGKAAKRACFARLSGSGRVAVEGKRVRLAAA